MSFGDFAARSHVEPWFQTGVIKQQPYTAVSLQEGAMSQKHRAGPLVEEFGQADRIEIPMPGGFVYAGEAAYHQREDLLDRLKGAYDNVAARSANPMTEHTTPHQREQPSSAIHSRPKRPIDYFPAR